MRLKFKNGGIVKLQNAATKIPYNSSTYDWIPDSLNTTQSIMDSFQEQADNTLQGYLRKRQAALEAERKNRTIQERILTGLNAANNAQLQSGMTEKVAQAYLDQGDIKGATDVSKEGLKGAGLGYLASASIPIVTEAVSDFATYGLLGGLGKQAGMWGGGYLLGKGGEEVGKGIDNMLNTGHIFENGLGIAGDFAGFGWGRKAGYNLAKDVLAKRFATKGINSVPKWTATNTMRWDLIKDAKSLGWRYNPTNYKKLSAWISNYNAPSMNYVNLTPTTATNADFSGIDGGLQTLTKENYGYGDQKLNFGLYNKWMNNRSKQIEASYIEAQKRNNFVKERFGKNWDDLTDEEKYGVSVNYGHNWDSSKILK